MWISTRSRFSGAIVSGVTMNARTPSIVVFSVHHRPVEGSRGAYRVNLRHGVSRIVTA